MKINQGKHSESVPPYNEIYNAYEPFFLNLLQQRNVHTQNDESRCYVPMPQIETRLKNFVNSGSSEICLLVGSIGIGKSSVLRHLSSNSWGNSIKTETIYLDLNRRKTSFQSLELPVNFEEMGRSSKRDMAYDRVSTYVASEIEARLAREIDFNAETEEIYDFVWENNAELLMPNGQFQPLSIEDKRLHLLTAQNNKRIPYLFVCLKYYALSQGVRNLVVVIDNCDQKDPILIEAFIDTLCHLDHCFENIKGPFDFLPRLTSVVSCRPSTRWMLESGKAHNTIGSHGAKVIPIETPCSLSELVKARTGQIGIKPIPNELPITSRNGMVWTFTRNEQFLRRVSESLESNHHGALLLSLCNWNVADGLSALAEVLSNRHFIDWDRIIVDIVPEEGVPEAGFSKNTILRAMAYGNPAGEPVYPTRKTRIPNILSGEKSVFPRTFIKPRLTQLVLSRSQNTQAFWDLPELLAFAANYFGKPEKDTLIVLDEMFKQGLIETNSGYQPSLNQGECEIFASARANCLWELLGENNFLIGFYRDDLELSARHQCTRVPTHELDLAERCLEDLAFLQDSLEGESRELEQIAARVNIEEFMQFYDDSLVTDKIFAGVGYAIFTFYQKYLRNFHSMGIEGKFKQISESLVAKKHSLFTNR